MRSRAGFTLIEVMVAMALTLVIMIIMSQAFVISLDTFSGMKGIGDMQINLRTAEIILRDDLSQDHFTGKRRLSDPNIVSQPPADGFFAVRRTTPSNGSPNYVSEGNGDANGLPSFRAVDHMIYMTVKRKGNRLENFFNAAINGPAAIVDPFFGQATAYNVLPPDLANYTWAPQYQAGSGQGIYASQWAEVLYYLVQTGSTESPNDPTSPLGTPTFGLYRAQFVMVPDATKVNAIGFPPATLSTFVGMSCNPGATLQFYSPADAALKNRVIPNLAVFNTTGDAIIGGAYSNLTSPPNPTNLRVFAGATLVCPNVLSFQVQVMQQGSTVFDDMSQPVPALLYDTTNFNTPGYPATGLKGIQITLRIWDNKTRQARQSTIVQDL